MIAPHILVISIFLSITWGGYLLYTVQDYLRVRGRRSADPRRRGDVVTAFRRMVVAFCLWLICAAYVFRTACVLVGLGDAVAGQVVFFSLIGSNVAGSLFALISLRYD